MLASPLTTLVFVFSHNDEESIELYLANLKRALIRCNTSLGIQHLYILANGCNDDTAERARRGVANYPNDIHPHVVEIAKAGKSNAWNYAIHSLAYHHPEACVCVFLDSDIELENTDIGDLVTTLGEDPHALAVVSHARKRRVPFAISTVVPAVLSRSNKPPENGKISGSLYAIRKDYAARIWMPSGLLVEDGFLAACLRTKLFSQEPDDSLIVAHPKVFHQFEAETSAWRAIKHEERTEMGSHMNFIAFSLLWNASPNAETWLRTQYEKDPDWLIREFQKSVLEKGWRSFRWARIMDPFTVLTLSPSLPAKASFALLRSMQRGMALIGAYRRAKRGDLNW